MRIINSREVVGEGLDPFLLIIVAVKPVEKRGDDRLLVIDTVLH